MVDGLKLATDAGNPRAANTALLGAVSKRLDTPEEYWMKAIEKLVPSKAFAVNRKSFLAGRNL
jgi:indolepyruvate ferredoxin oxidoreductase beta subunit